MCSSVVPSRATVLVTLLALLCGSTAGQASLPRDFKFTRADEKLLNEAEAIDRQLEKKGFVFNDSALDARIETLVKPILASVGTPERVHWKLRVLRDPAVNAFALPNGSVYVDTGLLALLENDAQLAGILAREIGHATNRDAYRQFRTYRNKTSGRNVVEAAALASSLFIPAPNLASGTGTYWGALIEAVGGISDVAMATSLFGDDGELEREADTFAVNQIAGAGYDPRVLPEVFKLLDARAEAELVTTFYSNHSKLEERVKYTTSLVKDMPSPSVAHDASGPPYVEIVERAVRYNIGADIDSRRFRAAVAGAQHLVNLRPNDPEDTVLLAEAYRALGARTAAPSAADLTPQGKARTRKNLKQLTVEEEQRELLSRPDGPSTLQANQEKAEGLYRKAQAMNAAYPEVYRGLGLLYEERGQTTEAQAAYRKYVELAPEATDTLRIRRRLDALDRRLQ